MRRVSILVAFSAVAALALSGGAWAQMPENQAGGHVMITPDEMQWADAPSLGPGAKIAVLEGTMKDDSPFTAQIKLPANFKIPLHTHPVTERVTVISGALHLGIGDKFEPEKAQTLWPGSVAIMQPGVTMFAFTEGETVFQLHGTGPWGIDYLNPEDNPAKR